MIAAEQHRHNKNRKFLCTVLILVSIIILLATLFLAVIIYKALKSGAILFFSPFHL